ncbi:MAG TPA: DUF1365 domain-containing protein [Mycobacteriales bacterium]|nr:DUF1365 domain-containing protein [Mycobacteriales bacterium]
MRHAFTYQGYQWLVDLDALPRLPGPLRPLARFKAADHLGDPTRSIRANLDRFLAAHDVDLAGGQVLMLTQARVLGYVFNPLSVFWCHDRSGQLVCVVAEVHNTYGDRHAYLLRTDAAGRARTLKQFYVSPFNPVDGEYAMSLPEPGAELALTISLHRPDGAPFVATVRGVRRPATPLEVLRTVLRHPLAPLAGAARIRRQGIALWLRGLRPAPRPTHHQEGVS